MQPDEQTQAPADQDVPVQDESTENTEVEATEATEAPADSEEAATDTEAPAEEAAEDQGQAGSDAAPEAPAAEDLHATNSGVDLSASKLPATDEVKADTSSLTPAEQAQHAADPTPAQEAAGQVGGPGKTDGTGILTQTNQDVIDNLPRNESGQVEIDETGRIVGLEDGKQPAPGNITGPAKTE